MDGWLDDPDGWMDVTDALTSKRDARGTDVALRCVVVVVVTRTEPNPSNRTSVEGYIYAQTE